MPTYTDVGYLQNVLTQNKKKIFSTILLIVKLENNFKNPIIIFFFLQRKSQDMNCAFSCTAAGATAVWRNIHTEVNFNCMWKS